MTWVAFAILVLLITLIKPSTPSAFSVMLSALVVGLIEEVVRWYDRRKANTNKD